MLILVTGDAHIPHRAPAVPARFKTMLLKKPDKIDKIYITGNSIGGGMESFLQQICSKHDIVQVKGDFDHDVGLVGQYAKTLEDVSVTTVGSMKVGMLHGHQIVPWGDKDALKIWQQKLGCDILITGHTHEQDVFVHDNVLYVNPGSLTGAFSSLTTKPIPSFVLLNIDGNKVTCYKFQLNDEDQLDIHKELYEKQ